MGGAISVDKYTSTLDDILQLNSRLLGNTKFEGNVPPQVSHHVKLWRFYEEDEKIKIVNHTPLNLTLIRTSPIEFHEACCYLGVTVTSSMSQSRSNGISGSIRETLTSATRNLSPRGLRFSLCDNKIEGNPGGLGYQLYILNGKVASHSLKSQVFAKGLELQRLIQSCSQILPIFFGGGVVRNRKLQKGSVVQLVMEDENLISSDIKMFSDTIGMFKEVYRSSSQPKIINLLRMSPTPLPQVLNPQRKVMSPPSLPIASLRIKPPMLNLALRPFQQARYQQIQQEMTQGVINFDIRATHRHQLKMEHCQSQCSQIVQGLFVSGQKVAKDLDILKKNNITHIVNCAGDYCDNWFEKEGIVYLSFFLKDSQAESIECLFYKVIEFIQNAQSKKKSVLIHCIQGISRSITMAIAYVIFVMKLDYKRAEAYVKQKRHVASPNNGFMVELIQFYKRLYEGHDSLISPRTFLVSSHCKQTPGFITARLLKYPLFDNKKNIGLDCRGTYIIQTPDLVYIWVGRKCTDKRREHYEKYAKLYVQLLQKHEKAPSNIKTLRQGLNDDQLFSVWNVSPSEQYQNNEYNNLFPSLEEGTQSLKPGINRKLFSSEIQEEEPERPVKHKLFVYPDSSRALGVFDKEDLSQISLLLRESEQQTKIFVWRQKSISLTLQQQDDFISQVVERHLGDQSVTFQDEVCNRESDEFVDCFQ